MSYVPAFSFGEADTALRVVVGIALLLAAYKSDYGTLTRLIITLLGVIALAGI
ncbi:MAG: hypothetical protein V3T30_04960 [Thermodesulfobacteriota bacterium]